MSTSDLDRRALLGVVGLAGVAALAARPAHAGPLDPPAGPVAGTGKQLIEIEPRTAINPVNTPGDANSVYKITQPGSYYLTANLAVGQGIIGIKVAANNVTIDLCGFSIGNTPQAVSSVAAIMASGTISGITIRNGRLAGAFQFAAINMFDSGTGNELVVEDVTIVGNGQAGPSGAGIYANNNYIIRNCVIISTGAYGLYSGGSGGLIESCYVRGGGGAGGGFILGNSTMISRCVVDGKSAGIQTGSGCTVTDCIVSNSLYDGISVNDGCLVARNICRGNGVNDGAGIHVYGTDNRIEDNTCTNADRGIDVDAGGNIILRNTCSGNGNNWDLAANNIFGPIVDRTSPGSGAVTGNSAVSTLGSTDANANFSY